MRIKYLFTCILIIFIYNYSKAQQEAANWYFGDGAGLSFTSGQPVAITGKLQTIEGSASISDRNGNLLFYTDGSTVYDRNHNVMQNGSGLKGNVSSTQSAIIVPKPGNPGFYFIFTVDKPDYFRITNDPIEGVHFSEVDMSLNNGNGGIMTGRKNIHLITYNPSDSVENEFKSSEKISAVIGGDCVSYWVVTQFTNKFYSFKVTSSGVDTNPVVSTISNNFRPLINDQDLNVTAPGYMKISPDGKKLAAAYSGTALGSPRSGGGKKTGKVFLYDFDDMSGKVSNETLLLANAYPYGVEFSPDSKKLYATSNTYSNDDILQSGELYQFDLEAADVQSSIEKIHSSRNVAGALQLAPDGKIYRAGYPTDGGYVEWDKLSVINNPEEDAGAVDYDHNSVSVAPRDVKLGLPPFVQSLFNTNFEYENICLGETTEFELTGDTVYDSILWDFGDGSTSTETNPSHVYAEPGTYTVSISRTLNGIPQDPVCEEVTIFGIPSVPSDYVLKQCDVQDDNSQDGLAEFNLQLAKEYLTDGNPGLQLYFYTNRQAAENDEDNQNSLDNIFRNTTPNQEIFVKINGFGSNCYDITSMRLQTTESVNLNLSPSSGCDLGDGEAEFNFRFIEENAISELGLDDSVSLTFHETESEAILGENPLPEYYISAPREIFIRADSDNFCYGFGKMQLEITSLPQTQQINEFSGCADSFPLELGTDINIENPSEYFYQWSTGETGETIQVTQAGQYTLDLILRESGCGREMVFNIEKFEAPEIDQIEITNHGKDNELNIITNSSDDNVVYALDNRNGPYQSSPVFRGVPGGKHTVFVKNDQACEVGEANVMLYGFPEFFSPNNDGYNDLWRPYDIPDPDYRLKLISIYDRYGKLLVQLPYNTKGWDGNFNGNPMPSDDYWFEVELANGKTFKSHFSLIRNN